MSKNTIIFVLVIIGILGVFLWKGGGVTTAVLPVDSQLEKGSQITTETAPYDFGTISMQDGNVTTSYVVANNTDTDIRVDSIVTSCMCTTAYLVTESDRLGPYGMPGHGNTVPRTNEIIKAGEKWVIEVVFDPAAHGPEGVGLAERFVYLIDDGGGALELEFKALVIL